MDTATTVDKEALTKRDTEFTAAQAEDSAQRTCTCHQRPVGKWDMDCEAVVGSWG